MYVFCLHLTSFPSAMYGCSINLTKDNQPELERIHISRVYLQYTAGKITAYVSWNLVVITIYLISSIKYCHAVQFVRVCELENVLVIKLYHPDTWKKSNWRSFCRLWSKSNDWYRLVLCECFINSHSPIQHDREPCRCITTKD